MGKSLLDQINSPDDVKALSDEQLPRLMRDIRRELVDTVTRNGGHLASNLGIVELTVAMHRVFDSPRDHFIFDVGHQSYVHKLLTGRKAAFSTLRTPGGLSGFTKREESAHDPYGCGHSSTSLSAAIGFAVADKLQGNHHTTVAVIGDGAFTGGMIHEALNNIERNLNLIIILNENEMSISPITGKFAGHLSKLRSTASYFAARERTSSALKKIPIIGNSLYQEARVIKRSVKNMIYHTNYFEELGIRYIGPVNGNDYERLELVLREAKKSNRSVLVHIKTKKGYGYHPAELNPGQYHALPPKLFYHSQPPISFHPEGGYSILTGKALVHMMSQDPAIVAITAAMADGTGLLQVQQQFPKRFFDVGIAEDHALTFATGLRAEGMKPVFAVYSSFLQRSYDSILHDMMLQNLPVTLCIDRCGLNCGDGVTHHGIFDVSFLSEFPGLSLYAPLSQELLMKALMKSVDADTPTAIRYSKQGPNDEINAVFHSDADALLPVKYRGDTAPDHIFITYGDITLQVMKASDELRSKGIKCGIILCEQLSPYCDVGAMVAAAIDASVQSVTYVEEGIRSGGFAMNLSDVLRRTGHLCGVKEQILAIDHPFLPSEKDKTMLQSHGLSAAQIAQSVMDQFDFKQR